ncbi:MAG: YqgE/AlgH family protein [Planktomarina sp.]
METLDSNLAGKLLVAMPGMTDSRFEHSVIFMCAHSEEGAMGLIVNKPAPDLEFKSLLEQLSISPAENARDIHVHFGGPVENGRGFVLHSADYDETDATLQVDDHFGMTATIDVLEDLAEGNGPDISLLALGYAGWAPGQIEAEILQNGWLTCDASFDIVFGLANDQKWTGALQSIGVDPLTLSASAGHA